MSVRKTTSAASLAVAALVFLLTGCSTPAHTATAHYVASPRTTTAPTPAPTTTTAPVKELTQAEVDALPRLSYSTVVPGLIGDDVTQRVEDGEAYRLAAPTIVYSDLGRWTPVGVLTTHTSIAGQPFLTVVAERSADGSWARILTPSRKTLPSQDAHAPAQTSGWVPASVLVADHPLNFRVEVGLAEREARVVTTDGTARVVGDFKISVGKPGTETPIGTTILSNRYTDPSQTADGVINLLQIHSAAEDSPLDGGTNGVIAAHAFPDAQKQLAVSHGCIRLSRAAADAAAQLPLGTVIEIVPSLPALK